ncbi:hypothetical protein HF680_12630 [Brevundimonas sp. WCHBH090558]|nr:hypothetical protein [Brevundimonas huaxiensis]
MITRLDLAKHRHHLEICDLVKRWAASEFPLLDDLPPICRPMIGRDADLLPKVCNLPSKAGSRRRFC